MTKRYTEDELKERVARRHRGLLSWVAKRREKEMEESMKRVRKMKPPPENWEGMIKYRLEGLTNRRRRGSNTLSFCSEEPFAMYSHTAATIDYALRKLANFGSRHSFRNDRFVTVDVLGAEKEIDQLSTTCAALHWLHCIDNEGNIVAPRGIHLNFVGPEVPCDWKLIDPSSTVRSYPRLGTTGLLSRCGLRTPAQRIVSRLANRILFCPPGMAFA